MLRRSSLAAALLVLTALVAPAASAAGPVDDHDEDAIVVVSGDVTVSRGEVVGGVFIVSGDARIAGRVDGDVAVLDGDVLLTGTVEGDLFTAAGTARLGPTAEVTGDVQYGDERPVVSLDARVHGDVEEQDWPEFGDLFAWIGGFVFWLAITLSLLVLGALLLLVAPRAADTLYARSRERVGPTIAIGIAIAIVLPVLAFVAAITLLGLPLAIGIVLALGPLGAIAYVTAAFALGRRWVGPPRHRMLALLAGLAALRLLALVPVLGAIVGIAAVIFGLGLIGAAIGAARDPGDPEPARTPDS
ncbi:MAG TPA: polymer-forming cytoskeletal protein [Solirubrobacterales bacterium]|nr:polymer-forming cytoskeletal protein [Solirubrobacterales bacterium]